MTRMSETEKCEQCKKCRAKICLSVWHNTEDRRLHKHVCGRCARPGHFSSLLGPQNWTDLDKCPVRKADTPNTAHDDALRAADFHRTLGAGSAEPGYTRD